MAQKWNSFPRTLSQIEWNATRHSSRKRAFSLRFSGGKDGTCSQQRSLCNGQEHCHHSLQWYQIVCLNHEKITGRISLLSLRIVVIFVFWNMTLLVITSNAQQNINLVVQDAFTMFQVSISLSIIIPHLLQHVAYFIVLLRLGAVSCCFLVFPLQHTVDEATGVISISLCPPFSYSASNRLVYDITWSADDTLFQNVPSQQKPKLFTNMQFRRLLLPI